MQLIDFAGRMKRVYCCYNRPLFYRDIHLFFIKRYQQLPIRHALGGFDQLWEKKIDWLEAPNRRISSWCGLWRLVVGKQQGARKHTS